MERNRKADTLNFLRDCGLEANKNILQSQDLGLGRLDNHLFTFQG